MAAAGYVGIDAEAARWLASAAERAAEDTRATGRRVAALFAEAGELDTVGTGLAELEWWLSGSASDVRQRADVAAVAPISGVDPTCQVPWTDLWRRMGLAVWRNTSRPVMGAANSSAETVGMVWQLVPVNDGWQQAWVDLGAGISAAWNDPRAAGVAMLDYETLSEEGFSYWIGGFIPDVAGMFLGGAGAVKLAGRGADAAHALRVGRRLTDATRRLPRRGGGAPDVDVPLHAGARPRRQWRREREARARVRAEDGRATASPSARGEGHSATIHGRRTSLRQQLMRAVTGVKPDGTVGYPVSGSRFFRWQDQDEAITRAKALWTPGRGAIRIDLKRPIGEGHMTKTLEYRRTTLALVRFDAHGNAYTSYPHLDAGGPLP